MNCEVTLSQLRQAGACISGYNKVVRSIQGVEFSPADEARETYLRFAHKSPVTILSILDSNGIDDAIWALRCVPGVDRDARRCAGWCARQVQHLMTDQRSLHALEIAERFANGSASADDLAAAGDAAWDAAGDAAGAAQAEWLRTNIVPSF